MNKATEQQKVLMMRMIATAFSGSEVPFEYHDNYDDTSHGFEISMGMLMVIRVKMYFGDPFNIRIDKYIANTSSLQVKQTILFIGDMPADDNKEPDEDFICKILKNWTSIG